jgi:hypothetical protein
MDEGMKVFISEDEGVSYQEQERKRDLLFAIVTCEARKDQADAQRETWVKDVIRADVRFFLAKQDRPALPDEVFLDVDDGYASLPAKVREISRWADKQGYLRLLKLDDDVVLFPGRMIEPQGHYAGWKQEPASDNWCSGLAYWLSRDAMRAVAQAELTDVTAEDRWTGKALRAAGFTVESAQGIQWFGSSALRRELPPNWRGRMCSAFVAGEFNPKELKQVYVY